MRIRVEDLAVTYRLYHERVTSIKELLVRRSRARYEDLTALSRVSFTVGEGEVFGVIGENGSGKSTLLKTLAGVIEADRGTIETNGRVASLLELGAGFHPDLTGRENVYLYAAILGLTRKEVDGHFDAIVEFSEVGDFIDVPVRNYSSGMYVRLGFSVAAHVTADILLVDEVLAVGDEYFQAKCLDSLREHRRRGAAIVLVSHDLRRIEEFCTHAIWLDHGDVRAAGSARKVVDLYRASVREDQEGALEAAGVTATSAPAPESARGKARIVGVTFLGRGDEARHVFDTGEPFGVAIDIETDGALTDPVIGVSIHRNDGVYVGGFSTVFDGISLARLAQGGRSVFRVPELPLLAGTYVASVGLYESDLDHVLDYSDQQHQFGVRSAPGVGGLVLLEHEWQVGA